MQREVEALGADLAGALQLIAGRAQTLVRASGAAIALATADPNFMDCRASAGPGAPPVGARLQVGSGFSGECVKTGRLLRCDDTDLDSRVDAESCRALRYSLHPRRSRARGRKIHRNHRSLLRRNPMRFPKPTVVLCSASLKLCWPR